MHEAQTPQGSAVGPFTQFSARARIRAVVVLPDPRWPANTNAAVGLANTQHKLGDLEGAEKTLRQASERDPGSVVALNNLAQTLSDLGRNDEALEVIDRAAAAGGPFADTVADTRKTILQKLGRQGPRVERLQ